jgi:hypothetical protein
VDRYPEGFRRAKIGFAGDALGRQLEICRYGEHRRVEIGGRDDAGDLDDLVGKP